MDLPHGPRVTALTRCLAFLLFLGMFAQTVARITGWRGHASAFPAMAPRWLVNYGQSLNHLLVVQLFLINLNTYTELRQLSKAEFVACVHCRVVSGVVAAEPCPCSLGSLPARPGWATAAGRDLHQGNRCAEASPPLRGAFKGLAVCFFSGSYFLMPTLMAVFGRADDSGSVEGAA